MTGTGIRGGPVRRNDGRDDNGGDGFAALHGVAGGRAALHGVAGFAPRHARACDFVVAQGVPIW